jgi:3',5'-cyclic AMP phosphodiesterase CpdA
MRLIHITDPHLSSLEGQSFGRLRGKRRSGYLSWRKNRRQLHRIEVLNQLTAAVAGHAPDQILLTGDLVHIGLEQEVAEAADWLRRLGPPEKVLLIPGNHDNYAADSGAAMARHWSDYLPEASRPAADYTSGYPVIRQLEQVQLIGLNTSCVTRIFSAAGQLGDEQRERLAIALQKDDVKDHFRCLLIHHPPFPGMTQRRKALRDADRLLRLLRREPPDLLLYGHIHRNRETLQDGIHCFCTASASSIIDASFRIIDIDREPAGWHCRVRLMRRDSEKRSGDGFSLVAESAWRR